MPRSANPIRPELFQFLRELERHNDRAWFAAHKQRYLDRVRDVFGFEPPRAHGHHTVESVEAMENGTAKVFIGMGGNFVRAIPDTDRSYAAMRKLALTVGIATKLNRGHLVHGRDALILRRPLRQTSRTQKLLPLSPPPRRALVRRSGASSARFAQPARTAAAGKSAAVRSVRNTWRRGGAASSVISTSWSRLMAGSVLSLPEVKWRQGEDCRLAADVRFADPS